MTLQRDPRLDRAPGVRKRGEKRILLLSLRVHFLRLAAIAGTRLRISSSNRCFPALGRRPNRAREACLLLMMSALSEAISQKTIAKISYTYPRIPSSTSGSVFGTFARMALMSTSLPRAARSFRYRSASKADSFSAKTLLTIWFTETPSVCARRFACWLSAPRDDTAHSSCGMGRKAISYQ